MHSEIFGVTTSAINETLPWILNNFIKMLDLLRNYKNSLLEQRTIQPSVIASPPKAGVASLLLSLRASRKGGVAISTRDWLRQHIYKPKGFVNEIASSLRSSQ